MNKQEKLVSIDIETTGLNLVSESILSVQSLSQGKAVIAKKPDKKLVKMLESDSYEKIIHNAVFDSSWIQRHFDVRIRNIWDTKLMEAIILGVGYQRAKDLYDEWSTSLGAVLKRRKIANLDKSIRETFIGHRGKLTKEQEEYALDDVRYLEELRRQQKADIKRLGIEKLAWLENKTVEVVARMKVVGIGFNEKVWLKIAKKNSQMYNSILKDMPTHVNWNSHIQIKKFFGRKGIRIDSLSDLDTMKGQHTILDMLIELRKYHKKVTTYGEGWLINSKSGLPTVDPDHRVRCDFEQIIQTGRFSSSNPNLQQLPSDGEHRAAFVPKKGYKFIIGDFTGQELGIMAAAAKEPKWITAMEKNDDVHVVMGRELYGQEWDDAGVKGCTFPKKCKCPEHNSMRKKIKDLNFGLAYGKGPKALAIDMGLTDQEAFVLIRQYKRKIPNITKWLEHNGRVAVARSESRTLPPFNRYRNLELEGEDWRKRNQGKNTPVQGTGADILKLAMVKIFDYIAKHNLFGKIEIVLTVHDEIVVECIDKLAKKFSVVMKQLMEEAAFEILQYKVVKTTPVIQNNLTKPD